MIVTIHQPNLLPRLKVLQKLAAADVWIVLNDVQFVKREYQNRAMIVSNHGNYDTNWLTVPVKLCNGRKTLIKDVMIADPNYFEQIAKVVEYSYIKDKQFKVDFEKVLFSCDRNDYSLQELCVNTTRELLKIADKTPTVIYSSDLNIKCSDKTDRLVKLCKEIGADTYLCDSGGARYIDKEVFLKEGINLIYQKWINPTKVECKTLKQYIRNASAINLLARDRIKYSQILNEICFVEELDMEERV
jgi:hypothetical protein